MALSLTDQLAELIHRTTSDLPEDVEAALRSALHSAAPGPESSLLRALLDNVSLARGASSSPAAAPSCSLPGAEASCPLCQDTGTLTFFWHVPPRTDTSALQAAAESAVVLATARGWLRRNTIDSLTGRSIDTNVVPGSSPVCHFRASPAATGITVTLLQKGGGSENMSRQFSLPDASLSAGRDLDGVRKCLLRAVWEAQGYGCAPGILGVCIGADRAEGYLAAKEQLLRPLTETSPDASLAALESRVLSEANSLGIGPMGMGGHTTLLGVKITARPRLPASFFVTVAYCCWACRRRTANIVL